jgi:hypothetical protein
VFDFASGRDERSGECPLLDREEYFVEEVSDGFGVADEEHVSGFWDDMGWGGEADGEDLVAAAMDMVEGLGGGVVPPLQYGDEGPVDETVIAGADHLPHKPASRGGARPYGVFDDHAQFEEAGRYESFELKGAGDTIKSWEVVGNGDAADEDRANRRKAFGHFHCHDAAEGEACEDKRFSCVDLFYEPVGVIAKLFFFYGGYPVNIGGFVAFG